MTTTWHLPTPPRPLSPGRLGEVPLEGPPSKYPFLACLLGVPNADVIFSIEEINEATRWDLDQEELVSSLVDE